MSVDVEDYFMVEAFAGSVSRDSWDSWPSRVEMSTRRALDLFERHYRDTLTLRTRPFPGVEEGLRRFARAGARAAPPAFPAPVVALRRAAARLICRLSISEIATTATAVLADGGHASEALDGAEALHARCGTRRGQTRSEAVERVPSPRGLTGASR